MKTFVTTEEVDALIGQSWRYDADAERAVMLANIWLGGRGLSFVGDVPEDVKRAGAELVKLAVSGKLYADKQTGVLAETVQADSVSVSQTFDRNAEEISAEMQIVETLIKPYLSVLSGGNRYVVPLVRM